MSASLSTRVRELEPAASSKDAASADPICERASALADELLQAALEQQTNIEREEAFRLARMMEDPAGKAFTLAMVDEVFRSADAAAEARRWRSLLRAFGLPEYLSLADRALLLAGAVGSLAVPSLVMRAVEGRMRAESARVILPAESGSMRRYLLNRTNQGFRININHLGEAVLGEAEAVRRLELALTSLAQPEITYLSIKISAIVSQISLIAWRETLEEIKARLRILYRAAMQYGKFINLDMEEYRDLELTRSAFREVLDEPDFLHLSAGIALQAYLPDSFRAQCELTEWARSRVVRGGAPIKIRLVKGANLAMETVEAEMHGWHRAPYQTKAETDANFRRMLEYGCDPQHAAAARLGVASHNLFDVALALTLRDARGVSQWVEIEMLEGMANHQARAVRDRAHDLLLYAPVVRREDFLGAMAYLVRRLDENTAPENFLREMFALRPESEEWERQRARFIQGWKDRALAATESRRRQPAVYPEDASVFQNEPDTDWTQPATRSALMNAITAWRPAAHELLPDLDSMLESARGAQPVWEGTGISERAKILHRVAEVMASERFSTIACMQHDGKKSVAEADAEVCEAIDFARYYARTGEPPAGVKAEALGVMAVISPWNFPLAIPVGGVCAALMAGNSVILKPSRATAETAAHLVRQFWRAGAPREALHFFPCDDVIGRSLVTDPRVAAIVLTGSYSTARKFQQWRPSLPLFAETSGKNALVITAQADRELAIKDLVRSAFSHSGQKCSAASLAILEAEVYDDPVFRRQLRDAVASLPVGPAADLRSYVTPLVLEPGSDLLRGLTVLDEGEEWLVEPRQYAESLSAWTPGVRLGVRPGSWFHRTECFGPVLGLMRAASLEEAVKWQNGTDYGLTAGLHSLDHSEIAWWRERVQAGNLYINRPITGAIVQRQPFGGWKRSCIGPGAKAGGPNYVLSFCHLSDETLAEVDYRAVWQSHFSVEHDPSALRSESNLFRYRPCRGVVLRLENRDHAAIRRAETAAQICGVPLTISIQEEESDEQFIASLPRRAGTAEFLRTISAPADDVLRAAYDAGFNWINAPILARGRIELTRWLREQSVSQTRHRYGQLPDSGAPSRK